MTLQILFTTGLYDKPWFSHFLSRTAFFCPLKLVIAPSSSLLRFLSAHSQLLFKLCQEGKIPLSRVKTGVASLISFSLGNILARTLFLWDWLFFLGSLGMPRAPSQPPSEMHWIPIWGSTPSHSLVLLSTASWEKARGDRGSFVLELTALWALPRAENCFKLWGGEGRTGCHRETFRVNFLKGF